MIFLAACTASTSPGTSVLEPGIVGDSSVATTSPVELPDTLDDFDEFVEESFAALVRRDPEWATSLGVIDELGVPEDRLTDLSAEFATGTHALVNQILVRLDSFDELSPNQELSRRTFAWHLEREVEAYRLRLQDWPVHFLLTSYNQGLIGLFTEVHPIENVEDAGHYLARLEQVDDQVGQVLANLEAARDIGVLPPRYVVDVTINQLRSQLAGGNARDTEIFQSFSDRLDLLGLDEPTASEHIDRAEAAVASSFVPAWTDLIEFLEAVRPEAGEEISLSRLPQGSDFYESLLLLHSGTDLAPAEIHQIGRDEIARIHKEMTDLAGRIGWPDLGVGELRAEFAEVAGFVSSPGVVGAYEAIIDDAYRDFAPFFTLTPSSELEVVNDPGPVAFYIGPAADGSRPGSFHAGTGGGTVARYTMRSLAHHEAVPGHHFQISLAQELDLPSPQKHLTNTAHVEGWALYAERLAGDVGLYDDDPASDFGRLDFELLRAARLVVDTGIHDLGWSRDEAITEMTDIMGGPEYNLEVDRYVVYPGQATGYMIGMNAILDLRERMGVDIADEESLAAFHDLILGHGNVPMAVLEEFAFPGP